MQQEIVRYIQDCGFEQYAVFDTARLRVRTEVRAMCAADKCHAYAHSWSCPPACGTLEHWDERMHSFSGGIVFQTVGQMEDEFDFAAIERTSDAHKARFMKFAEMLADAGLDGSVQLLAAGTCTLCERCTYPDAPCVHPELMYPSMEACGLLVTEVCELAGLPYYHGPCTTAFFSCVLFN